MTQSEALAVLQTGVNVFLTGEPGSGKSHTVREYVHWLRSHAIEPSITASTGIAATHIGGLTIHSWSGIGVRNFLSPADLDQIASKEHVARRIQKASVLIIDEISMLSGSVLDMVNEVCKEVRRNPHAFGGLQVVVVGDFFQLPPISRAQPNGERAPNAFAFKSRAWEEMNPISCYLSEQYRQEDTKFLEVLQAVRGNRFDESHASLLMAREHEAEGFEEEVPRLYTHNVDVDRVNEQALARLPGKAITYGMNGTGSPVLVEALKRGCLSPESLTLKENAIVMGTKNIPLSGLANGTLGVVVEFERGTNYPIIELRDGTRQVVAPSEWHVEENGKIRASISQIPLRLAWAITVHKSQGMSMDAAAIDLSRTFEYGQGYVALSRVRSLAGLYLLGWNEQAWQVAPEVALADAQFRSQSEAAGEQFQLLEESGERGALRDAFIKASGGTLTPRMLEGDAHTTTGVRTPKVPKESTYNKTLTLLKEGMTADEVAKERSLTLGTIAGHLEKLSQDGSLTPKEVASALPPALVKVLPAILPVMEKVFAKTKEDKLAPVFSALGGKYSFDQLTLARLAHQLGKKK